MAYMPSASERMPREEMVRMAQRYPAGLRAGSFVTADVPFADDAYRFENGVQMAGPGCTFQPPGCENMRTQQIPTLPEVKERLVAVDKRKASPAPARLRQGVDAGREVWRAVRLVDFRRAHLNL
jgi:hypothetical protein